jgi:ATPase subunit of ABC transporter with duplicated ATPase domains
MPNTTPSQDFLNAVCTHTMWLANGTIKYYGGNYAKFVATVEEEERLQLRVYEKQQADMDKLEKFVEVNRANGVANSAKSKKKVLGKLQDGAVERPVVREPSLVFSVSASECSLMAPLIGLGVLSDGPLIAFLNCPSIAC